MHLRWNRTVKPVQKKAVSSHTHSRFFLTASATAYLPPPSYFLFHISHFQIYSNHPSCSAAMCMWQVLLGFWGSIGFCSIREGRRFVRWRAFSGLVISLWVMAMTFQPSWMSSLWRVGDWCVRRMQMAVCHFGRTISGFPGKFLLRGPLMVKR